tara:strand:- start:771 stop:1496 length:726 start_codon:yes stop_codon:yes gene_type:complete
MEELRKEGRLKEMREEKRLVLPYLGKVEGKCVSLRYEHGLYVQCSREKLGEKYCERCEKEKKRGINYGDIEDRMKVGLMEYIDPKGRKVVNYNKVMKKLNISIEDVKKECERLNIKIDPIHLEEKKSKRGRPRKEVIVDDTDSEKSEKKRGRGRPKKEKKKEEITGENLIEQLIKDRETKEKIIEKEEIISDDEDETEVCEFIFKNKKYLKSDENIIYDFETHEILGKWLEDKNIIEEYDE